MPNLTIADCIVAYLTIGVFVACYLVWNVVKFPSGLDERMDSEKNFMIESPAWSSLVWGCMIVFWLPAMLLWLI